LVISLKNGIDYQLLIDYMLSTWYVLYKKTGKQEKPKCTKYISEYFSVYNMSVIHKIKLTKILIESNE